MNLTAGPASDVLLAETMVKHGELDLSVEEMHEIILNNEEQRLNRDRPCSGLHRSRGETLGPDTSEVSRCTSPGRGSRTRSGFC